MRGFGEPEAAIMDRAWSSGRPLLVRDIQQTLKPARAYNTVWTVVVILYRKGRLSREKDGRAYRYRAPVSRADYTAGLMGEALAASTDQPRRGRRVLRGLPRAPAHCRAGPAQPGRRGGPARSL